MALKTLFMLACAHLALASPIAAPADPQPTTSALGAFLEGIATGLHGLLETYTKEGLTDEFKGLYWDYAFTINKDNKQECTKEMLDIIVPALRKTKEFTNFLTDPNRKDYNSDGAWHTFYIRPNPPGKTIVTQDWTFNDNNKAVFKAINDNVKIAATYPYNGGGSRSKAKRASIRCIEDFPEERKRCAKNSKFPAYTTQPVGTQDNTWITLCPKFFDDDIPKLAELTNKKKKSSELYTLRSREHIIAHEFMHVEKFGYHTFIDDLKDGADGLVYGGSRCSDYGWTFWKKSPSKVNTMQELNADTYGWWFTGVWFQNKWNWPYDTTSTAREGWTDANALKQYDDGTRDDGDGTLPVGGGSVFGGQSVHGGAPGPTCPGC